MENTILQDFQKRLLEINHYRRLETLLDWDLYTATPPNGYEGMSDTMAFVASKLFACSTDPKLLSLLSQLNSPDLYDTLTTPMQYTVRKMYRDLQKESLIPEEFIDREVRAVNASRRAWENAKQAKDYSIFAPHLQKMIDLTIERCGYTDPGKEPYDVLLDRYEEGMDADAIDTVFNELKEGLLPLLEKILSCPEPSTRIYDGTYEIDAQKKVQDLLLKYIGFSFASGTTAESEHPFTIEFSKGDVRVTNHYHEHDPLSAMFSAIHEGGHAIFGQNADDSLVGTPADDCPYMGIHESQSRFFENILGRRKSFWIPIYDKVQELLHDLSSVSLNEFVQEINHIRCSFIRTDANEVTYALHIILRYEMEQEIFRNHRSAEELPEIWNQKTKDYLHITPEDDSLGILQDMHWSDGSFGYFPSYLLGSIYDGMFLEAMQKDLGNLDELLSNGEIHQIVSWLNEKIHQFGAIRLPKEVLKNVCNTPLSAKPLLNYFREKYSVIYGFEV